MDLSIVMGTRGRDEFLKNTLYSLLTQLVNREDYEIIVVNYGGTDKTREICESFKSGRIKYFYTNEKGIFNESKAKNIGLKRSNGRIVCFTNSDILFPKDIVKYIINFFKSNEHMIFKSNKHRTLKVQRWELLSNDLKKFLYPVNKLDKIKKSEAIPREEGWVGDCFCALRDDFFAEGGHNELIAGYGALDWELRNRLTEKGIKCRFERWKHILHQPHAPEASAPPSRLQVLGDESNNYMSGTKTAYYRRIRKIWAERAKKSTEDNGYKYWGNIKSK